MIQKYEKTKNDPKIYVFEIKCEKIIFVIICCKIKNQKGSIGICSISLHRLKTPLILGLPPKCAKANKIDDNEKSFLDIILRLERIIFLKFCVTFFKGSVAKCYFTR